MFSLVVVFSSSLEAFGIAVNLWDFCANCENFGACLVIKVMGKVVFGRVDLGEMTVEGESWNCEKERAISV